jgi:hypothetical protein
MSNEQDVSRKNKIDNSISWKSLGLRVLGVYILYSTASHIFDPYPVEYYWTPAQKFVSYALGYLLLFLGNFVFVSLFALLIARIPAKNRKKPLPPFLNGALIATIFLSAFLIHGGWYGNKMDAKLSRNKLDLYENVSASQPAPIIAAITSQGSGDLDQDALENLETWIVQTMLQKARNHYSADGFDPADLQPKVYADSVYMSIDGKKLAIIKIKVDNIMRSVTILGIEGSELIRVGCIRGSNHDIPVFSGECGAKVQKAFGLSVKL